MRVVRIMMIKNGSARPQIQALEAVAGAHPK